MRSLGRSLRLRPSMYHMYERFAKPARRECRAPITGVAGHSGEWRAPRVSCVPGSTSARLRSHLALLREDHVPGVHPFVQPHVPLCRAPFLETARSETEDGESPYTYSTRDYSVHAHFAPTNDYSGTGHSCASSGATRDYKAKDYSTSRTYTASEYKASEYKASDYSAPTAKYTSSTDYSSIAAKYSAAGSSSGDASR